MYLTDRLADFAFGYWRDRQMTEWPTIREAARALRARQGDIEQAIADDQRLQKTYYLVEGKVPLGEHFVEAYADPRTESAFQDYWRIFNRAELRVIEGGRA